MSMNLVTLLYLIASDLLHPVPQGPEPSHHLHPRQPLRHGRHGHRHPDHRRADRAARRRQGAMGMAWVLLGLVVGGGYGAYRAKTVEMTQMPELVAFFHSMIGLAAVFIAVAAVVEPWAFGITPPPVAAVIGANTPEGAYVSTASRASPFPRATGWSCSWARPSAPSPSAARSSPSASSRASTSSACSRARRCSSRASTCSTWCWGC